MSLRKILGRILLACMLQVGAFSGVMMTPEDIEKLMNIMHRTKVVHILKQDDDVR